MTTERERTRGTASLLCSGSQYTADWAVGIAQVSETPVTANPQRQAHQDRSQGAQPCPLRDISDGRGDGVKIIIP